MAWLGICYQSPLRSPDKPLGLWIRVRGRNQRPVAAGGSCHGKCRELSPRGRWRERARQSSEHQTRFDRHHPAAHPTYDLPRRWSTTPGRTKRESYSAERRALANRRAGRGAHSPKAYQKRQRFPKSDKTGQHSSHLRGRCTRITRTSFWPWGPGLQPRERQPAHTNAARSQQLQGLTKAWKWSPRKLDIETLLSTRYIGPPPLVLVSYSIPWIEPKFQRFHARCLTTSASATGHVLPWMRL